VFSKSITEAEILAQPEDFDFLSLVGDGFNPLRRYTPALLEALTMKAAPSAQELLAGVEVLKGMNERQARKVPDDAPTSFVRKRGESLVSSPLLAELERSLISERTRAGVKGAQRRGVKFGRKPKLTPQQIAHARKLIDQGEDRQKVAAFSKSGGRPYTGRLRRERPAQRWADKAKAPPCGGADVTLSRLSG
jgi:hypothetical protein